MVEIASLEAVPLWIPMSATPSRRFESDATGSGGIALTVAFLRLSDGPIGLGYNAEIAPAPSVAVASVIGKLAPSLVGRDALAPEALSSYLHEQVAAIAPGATGAQALSIIDVACWDALGKVSEIPLYRLLGGFASDVDAYGSGGRRGLSDADLVSECVAFAEGGFRSYKFKIGTEAAHDERRVSLLRKEMGEHFTLYADANQAYNVAEAIEVSRMLQEHSVAWFEEPVKGDAPDLLAAVAMASPVPIAAGESCYELSQFRALCEQRSVAFIQPDLGRCGGVTEFRKIASLAEAFDLKVASHLAPEMSHGLVAFSPAGFAVEVSEHMPNDVWASELELRDGRIVLSEAPGHGVELIDGALTRYAVP